MNKTKPFLIYDSKLYNNGARFDDYKKSMNSSDDLLVLFDFYPSQMSDAPDIQKYKAIFLHTSEDKHGTILEQVRQQKIPVVLYSGITTHSGRYCGANEIEISLAQIYENLKKFCECFVEYRKIDLDILMYGKSLDRPPYTCLLQSLYLFLETGYRSTLHLDKAAKNEIVKIGDDVNDDLWRMVKTKEGDFPPPMEESVKSCLDWLENFFQALESPCQDSIPVPAEIFKTFFDHLKKMLKARGKFSPLLLTGRNDDTVWQSGKVTLFWTIPDPSLPEKVMKTQKQFFDLAHTLFKTSLYEERIDRCHSLEFVLECIQQQKAHKLIILASAQSALDIEEMILHIRLYYESGNKFNPLPILVCPIDGSLYELAKKCKFAKIWFSPGIHVLNWSIPSIRRLVRWTQKETIPILSKEIAKSLEIPERIASLENEFRHDLRNETGFIKMVDSADEEWITNKDELRHDFENALAEHKNRKERFDLYRKLQTAHHESPSSPVCSPVSDPPRNLRILIVEDFSPWGKLFRSLPKNLEWEIDILPRVEEGGKEDLALFHDFIASKTKEKFIEYDLVILDLRLKEQDYHIDTEEMSGFRILKEIRARDFFVPVILFTSSHQLDNFRSLQPYQLQDIFMKDEGKSPFLLLMSKITNAVQKRKWLGHWHCLCELWIPQKDDEAFYYAQQAFYAIFYHSPKNELDTFGNPFHEAVISLKNSLDIVFKAFQGNKRQEEALCDYKYSKDFLGCCCFWLVANLRNLVAHGMGNNLIGEKEVDLALTCFQVFISQHFKREPAFLDKEEISANKSLEDENLWSILRVKSAQILASQEEWWGSFKEHKGIMELMLDRLDTKSKESPENRKEISILLLLGEILTGISEKEMTLPLLKTLIHKIIACLKIDSFSTPVSNPPLSEQKKRLLVPNTEEKKELLQSQRDRQPILAQLQIYALPGDLKHYCKSFKCLQDCKP